MASHSAAQGQTRYVYDASGQRTIKINADGSSHIFSYNQQGQLLFEGRYNAAKQLHSQRHYIWLNDTPVGFVVKNNNSGNNNGDWNIYAIHTDHLNTPRLLTNQDGAEMWRWASDAFGEGEAVGSIEFNLRFPGQYYDGESGLHYNYFRDYNAQTGRYVQSDPIGLQGGVNTYAYAYDNPVNYIDPLGLMSGFPSRDEHVNRNRNNRCPKKEPDTETQCSAYTEDNPNSPASVINGGKLKWRHSAGYECDYDSNGNLLPDINGNYSYNYENSLVPHIWKDVIPEFWYNGPGKDEYTPNLTTEY